MKKFTILFCIAALSVLFYPYTLRAQLSVEVSDTIRADETWSADTVKVIGNVTVVDNVTLTIAAGTYVEFQGYYYLNILGTILAVGTETDTIVFTPADTSGFTNFDVSDGAWNGIIFNNGVGYGGANGAMNDNDTSWFKYCRIEFSKGLPSDPLVYGGIEISQFSNLVISNCEIRYNYTFHRGAAIRFYANSDIKILNNYIHHNVARDWAGGIYSYESTPIISKNTITHNRTTSTDAVYGKGGGIGVRGTNPIIMNNDIKYNQAIYGSGIYLSNSFGIIANNTIAYNTGYSVLPDLRSIGGGIYMEQNSSPLIRNNIISNNEAIEAGGIYSIASQPEIINNLIVNNTGTDAGGAFFGWDSEGSLINNTICHNESPLGGALELTNTQPEFINNIIWSNGGFEIHLQDQFAYLNIKNCIIENGEATIWGAGDHDITSIIDKYPQFADTSAGLGSGNDGLSVDWSVSPGSPCVNAGAIDVENLHLPQFDLNKNKRIHHSVIDIGAYEVYVPLITFTDTIKSDTTWIADTVSITGNVTVNDGVKLTILPGTYVEFQDTFHIKVNGTLIAEGNPNNLIYFTMNINDTTGFAIDSIPDGGWQGIIFDNSYDGMNNEMKDNDTSVIRNCHFSFAKSPETEFFGGAIRIKYFSRIKIDDCIFNNNKSYYGAGAINLEKSNLNISNCEFSNNQSDEGSAIFAFSSDLLIINCSFTNNYSINFGGAVRTIASEAVINSSRFMYNRSGTHGGAIYLQQTPAIIRNCFLSNNQTGNRGGAICALYENCQLINNVIVNNTGGTGGGIYFLYVDDALTINNTICNNWTDWGGGGVFNAFVNHRSVNDILYGNESPRGNQYGLWSAITSLTFNNCNIKGGTADFFFNTGQELAGTFTNIIDSFPHFIRPSDGPGNIYDGINSNWNLKSISPCINAGTLNGIDNIIGSKDFAGRERIFADIIDIGAYESQFGPPVITLQPLNQVACAGDTVLLIVEAQFRSYYQWQKDGKDIPGSTNNEFRIDSIAPSDDGNYQCIVSNSFDSVASVPVYVVARATPEIILQPEDTWAVEGERTILSAGASGTPPVYYQWFKDGTELTGKKYPDLLVPDSGPNDEGEYLCAISNACGDIHTDTVQFYLAPQICMVTVDTATGNNLIVWEKNSSAPVESYNVYRESVVAGEYDLIGNILADDLSVFEDTIADPFSQGYIYKITALDAGDNESDLNLCKPHKTIHLLTSINTEEYSIQCDWDKYYGFDYGTFIIYRALKGSRLDSIHAISRSFSTWIDRSSVENVDYVYRIAARRLESCYPTGNTKAGTGPYSHSMSNIDDNRLQATGKVDIKSMESLQIFPNPFSDYTTIRFPNPDHSYFQLIVRDLSGKAVMSMSKITEEQVVINRGNLKAGYYSVEVVGEKIFRGKMIIE